MVATLLLFLLAMSAKWTTNVQTIASSPGSCLTESLWLCSTSQENISVSSLCPLGFHSEETCSSQETDQFLLQSRGHSQLDLTVHTRCLGTEEPQMTLPGDSHPTTLPHHIPYSSSSTYSKWINSGTRTARRRPGQGMGVGGRQGTWVAVGCGR